MPLIVASDATCPSLKFTINRATCTRCGLCVRDCPARIIVLPEGGYPDIPKEKEPGCYKCQHCLAICPTAALSILGLNQDDSLPLAGSYPAPELLERLIKGRRSVRSYRPENLEPELLERLLAVAWHAPTGVNARCVLFTLVDDRAKMAAIRDGVMAGLASLVRDNALPERFGFFADFVRLWEEKGVDIIFRNAPHLLITSVPPQAVSPTADCLIALSYFELYAQANGVGTVWNGLARWAIGDLVPETLNRLGIPEDHQLGYCMSFGQPAVQYARTVQHNHPLINRVR